MRLFRILLSLSLLAFLGACAASGTTQNLLVEPMVLADTSSVTIEVSTNVEDTEDLVPDLQNAIRTALLERGTFGQINGVGTPSSVVLKVEIIEANKVGGTSRILLGALAGRAKLRVKTEVFDGASGELIGAMVAEGKSSGGTVFAGTTSQAISRVAEQIGNWLTARQEITAD